MRLKASTYIATLALVSSQALAQDDPNSNPVAECFHQCEWEFSICAGTGGYANFEACDLTYQTCAVGCSSIGFNLEDGNSVFDRVSKAKVAMG